MDLLLTSYVPITLWPYVVQIAIFLIIILPTKNLYALSPFEVLYSKATIYDALKSFWLSMFSMYKAL